MGTEYPKIDTLYERDQKFKVQPGVFKNRTYSLLKTWRWTEKIDGTNIRIIFEPKPTLHVPPDLSLNPSTLTIGGRTDNANLPADLIQGIQQQVTVAKMYEKFQSPVVLYGEGYGGSIQKGGGYSQTKKFTLFDVLVDGTWWLNQEQVEDVAAGLGLEVVPFIGDMSLEDATEFVRAGFPTRISGADSSKMAEGLVGRPQETLYDKKMSRLITKLKTKDF